MGSGNNRCQLLDISDFLEAARVAMVLPVEEVNDSFNLGADKFGTVKEDFTGLIGFANTNSKIIHMPDKPLKIALGVLEKIRLSPLYKGTYDILDKDLSLSIEKAKEKLEWYPQNSNVQALIKAYNWYLNNYELFKDKKGCSNRMPAAGRLLDIIKRFF